MMLAVVIAVAFVAVELTRQKRHERRAKKAEVARAGTKIEYLWEEDQATLNNEPPKKKHRLDVLKSGVRRSSTGSARPITCAN